MSVLEIDGGTGAVLPAARPSEPPDLAEIVGRVAAAGALVLLLPVIVLVALLVAMDGHGSPFFSQTRVGRDGREFRLWKFRTMIRDAELVRDDLSHLNEHGGPFFKVRNDPRVTRLGRWLRRSSMDELPQLVNVLRGDMALVGPRPLLPSDVHAHRETASRRFDVKPGLTGLWQVSGRSLLAWDDALRLDVEYVDRRCLWLDVRILGRTIGAVLSGRGAF